MHLEVIIAVCVSALSCAVGIAIKSYSSAPAPVATRIVNRPQETSKKQQGDSIILKYVKPTIEDVSVKN